MAVADAAVAAADSWLRLGTFHTQVDADTADDHLLLPSSFHLRPSFYVLIVISFPGS